MGAFSEEFEHSLLERVDDIANKKLELEKQLINPLDIITAKQLKETLGISSTTLTAWTRKGLKTYRPPFDESKKLYFRASDVINFLSVR